jgi:hypothetical protein
LGLKSDVILLNVPSKKGINIKLGEKKIIFFGVLMITDETRGSLSQRYGSEDPDPYQNVTDLEHCYG